MSREPISEIPTQAVAAEDRFSRLRLIGWWNQQKIEQLRVLVVGCGALGNEILKNLALLGVRNIVIADPDSVEVSNLSRSVLFSAGDLGRSKVEAAADGVRGILPEARVRPLPANILHNAGLGLFVWADVIIAGLDNREARLWINRAAWKLRKPWVDGAIEGINGVARVFLPGKAPCYECTLGEMDWELLNRRMSCNLLQRHAEPEGKVPTTPTISSIIAGIEVQEAIKLAHDLPVLASKGVVFEGLNHTSYVVEYTENPDCQSHYSLPVVLELPKRSAEMTLGELLAQARADLGPDAVLEFSRDVIHRFVCPKCCAQENVFAPVGTVEYSRGYCPHDGEMRVVETVHSFSGEADIAHLHLNETGLPLYDVFTARQGEREIGYLIAGDAAEVLGPLAEAEQ